jgi:hypothetical protein
MRKPLGTLVREIQGAIARDVSDLIRTENEIAALAQRSPPCVQLEGKNISQLIEIGRDSSQRQYGDVCLLLTEAERKRAELLSEAPKPPPTTRELLRFNRPGRALIVEWLKQPGEIIQPDEPVFSFRYEESTKVVPWYLRVRAPVRMTSRAGGNGVWVSSEDPYLLEHVSNDIPVVTPGPIQQLRMAIQEGIDAVGAAENRLSESREQHAELTGQLDSIRRSHTAASSRGLLFIGALCGTGAFVFIHSGHWGIGIGLGVFAAYLGNAGRANLRVYRANRQALALSLSESERELSQRQGHAEREAAKLQALQGELTRMDTAAKETMARASAVLDRFEGSSLRKGGRLLPFRPIFAARKGDVVRVFDGQLARIAKDSGREITVEEDLPRELAAGDHQRKSKSRLVRVMEESATKMVLSHRLAYVAERTSR